MAKLNKVTPETTYRHERGWGHELWIENMPEYCGKILHIIKGKKGSLHFHTHKLETMYLQSGKIQLRLIDTGDGTEYSVFLDPGDSIRIPRGQPHQIIGLEESDLFEFSTIHREDDSHRIQKGD